MIRIRVHGRGGEGAVTLAHMLGASACYEGKFGQSCMLPMMERRGAPVEAFCRIDDKPITEHGRVMKPDYVVVTNRQLLKVVNLEEGIVDDGQLFVNSPIALTFTHEASYVDATPVALRILNIPIPNTVMLGAFAAATGIISLDSLEKSARDFLSSLSSEKLDLNLKAIRAGYKEVKRGKAIH
jgi:pyruvate ferredoxin oxidoreductase gamma subunit